VFEIVDDDFGGSAEWLASRGLKDPELDRLRDRIAPVKRGASGD
jgi:hypothetical protein